ncbi:MAG: hypothetical protein IPJ61_19565 [Tessaracoccus sp.]|uniref:5' nucleotidase, NT5C type n=1 Tax=Tessaracoccus sp. TaxID=1971211 RepID=UPI001EBE44CF|nr:hypothetical protein [Tessaracoccus sp.]MBK7823186.1 hypothetical protein [Tessaracoccus sp.]
MSRPVVLVDVDDVLADFYAAALRVAGEILGRDVSTESRTTWDIIDALGFTTAQRAAFKQAVGRSAFCASLSPCPGAQVGVAALREIADVYAVTAPFDALYWVSERDWWLKEHFGFTRKQIVHTDAKYLVAGDVFIDDKVEHVRRWVDRRIGTAVLWAQPYNAGAAVGRAARTNVWEDVYALAAEHP